MKIIFINKKISELIGIIIGDGCMSYKPKIHQYFVEIVGNINEEKEFFNYIKIILQEELNLKCFIKERARGLRLRIYSKNFVEYLVHTLGLIPNKEKCENILILKLIIDDPFLLNFCLRGIVDTDGSLFLANKGYRNDYLSIEISTISFKLAQQMNNTLSRNFRIGFRNYKQGKFKRIYRISLNGDKMVDKWFNEIGFSNQRNLKRYQKLKNGSAGI